MEDTEELTLPVNLNAPSEYPNASAKADNMVTDRGHY
jgi:hypothetical protein